MLQQRVTLSPEFIGKLMILSVPNSVAYRFLSQMHSQRQNAALRARFTMARVSPSPIFPRARSCGWPSSFQANYTVRRAPLSRFGTFLTVVCSLLPGIYATEISQADLERVITAVFVLQCRARFAATARAMIESRTHDRVYRAFSGVLHLSRGPREVPAGTAKHTQSLPLPQAIAMAQA